MGVGENLGFATKRLGKSLFSRTFGKLFGYFFVFIFLIIPLIYAIVISVQASNIAPGVNYMGQKFLNPLLTLGTESAKVINANASFVDTGNFFHDGWRFIILYWNLIGSFWIIWKWIRVFSWIYGHSFLSNDSQKFTNFSLGVLTFFGLTFLYLSLIAHSALHLTVIEAWKIPLHSLKEFWKAIPLLIKSSNTLVSRNNSLSNIAQIVNQTLGF
ncbi:MAG: hypothetical protein GXO79_11455 [Chlorobi bacterium]|nr:hypothetical protein [Chlorobiota bacterium]